MFNRRDFLKSSSLVAWGLSAPAFLTRTAAAAPSAEKPGARDTILVVVQLTGGNDGLNTVVPFTDPDYAKLRPTLKLPTNQLKKLNDSFALHPQMNGLAELWNDSSLCVVHGVGYPNPDQSHFRSMDIWQGASQAKEITEGWVGKALRGMNGSPAFHLAYNNESAPLAVAGAPVRVPSITSLEDFQLKMLAASGADKKEQREVIEGAAQSKPGSNNLLDFVRRTAVNTYESSKRLQEIAKNYQPKAPYPQTGLANRLKLAAQLISADLGARVFYVSIDGFDTHANQQLAHAQLLQEVSEAMAAFYKDMSAQGHKDRIVMLTFSEFGRRPYENGSRGTDHGAAAPMLLVGSKLKASFVGEQPSLTKNVNQGNLKHSIDFRQVYAALLDGWLGVKSKDVLGEEFKPADIIKQV